MAQSSSDAFALGEDPLRVEEAPAPVGGEREAAEGALGPAMARERIEQPHFDADARKPELSPISARRSCTGVLSG